MYIKYLFCLAVFTLMIALSNCKKKTDASNTTLVNQLSQLDGKYVKHDSSYFYDQKEKIAAILQKENKKDVLKSLADGMDNPDLSNSTIEGKKVPIGLLYYEALTQIVYFESVDSTGDIAAHWNGHITITPEVNLSHLQTAQAAWEKVIQSKTYIFL